MPYFRRSTGTKLFVPAFLLPFILVPAAIGFYFKKRAMPMCIFRIDEIGILRTTDAGALNIPWDRVIAIHNYRPGYLLAGVAGAIPLPSRCFSPAQFIELERLIEKRRLELNTTRAAIL